MAGKRETKRPLEASEVSEKVLTDLVNYTNSSIDFDSLEVLAERFREGMRAGAEITKNREKKQRSADTAA